MRAMVRIAVVVLGVLAAGCPEEGVPPAWTPPDGAAADGAVDTGGEPVDQLLPDSAPDALPVKPTVLILHTNDLHEHLLGWSPNKDYTPLTAKNDTTVGGFSRLVATIKAQRAAAGPGTSVLVLDGGDFTMGTLFTWLGASTAPTLRLMNQAGYDAVALGNHELEWGVENLSQRINAAVKAGVKTKILASNIVFSKTDHRDDGLEKLWAAGVIRRKLVRALPNGLKVGLFGLLGKSATDVALDKDPLTFTDPVTAAKSVVAELRTVDKVDLVIALSHSGIDPSGKGEDVDLAKVVPGIDVIVSGHTHDRLEQPAVVGPSGTRIVQTGKYGKALGRLELRYDVAKTLGATDYELIAIDDAAKGDGAVQQLINGFIGQLDAMLKPALAFKKVVAETAFDLTKQPFSETILGDLIADAYRFGVNKLQPAAKVDLAVASSGHIRDEVLRGKTGQIWFADLYRALPLGFGPDGKPGYPLVTYYLKGKEIKTWMEMLYLSEKIVGSKSMYFQVSGIQVEYDTSWVVPLFSVKSVKLTSAPTSPEIKSSDACYKVVTTMAIAEELSRAKSYTFGIWKIDPKLADCSTKISDLKQRIVDGDPAKAGLQEFKAWQALVRHVSGFSDLDADKVPDVPAAYAKPQGRIVIK